MKVSAHDLPKIAGEYLDAHFLPKAGFNAAFVAYYALYCFGLGIDKAVQQYGPIMQMLSLMDDNSMIDIEVAHNAAQAAIEKSGKVDAFGFLLDASDIESIYAIAQRYGR